MRVVLDTNVLFAAFITQGETLAELKENIREAIALYLETLREEGRQAEPDVQILDVAV